MSRLSTDTQNVKIELEFWSRIRNNCFNFQHTNTFCLKIILNLQIQSTVYSRDLFSGVDFVQLPQYLNPKICAWMLCSKETTTRGGNFQNSRTQQREVACWCIFPLLEVKPFSRICFRVCFRRPLPCASGDIPLLATCIKEGNFWHSPLFWCPGQVLKYSSFL